MSETRIHCRRCPNWTENLFSQICNNCANHPAEVTPQTAAVDPVTSPAHYTQGKIEVLAALEDWKLDFRLANVVKYVTRARYKGSEIMDLCKARFYLERVIKELEEK